MSLIDIWCGWTPYALPQGPKRGGDRLGSQASVVHFGVKFITQKLLVTPNLVGVGHLRGPQIRIWKDLGPVCFWSCGPSFSWRVYNTKVVVHVPNRYPPKSV